MQTLKVLKVVYIATIIGLLEAYALSMGIDGTALALTIAALAGLGGYEVGNKHGKVKN